MYASLVFMHEYAYRDIMGHHVLPICSSGVPAMFVCVLNWSLCCVFRRNFPLYNLGLFHTIGLLVGRRLQQKREPPIKFESDS